MLTEKEQFENFLHESFRDGNMSRELLLSDEELGYVHIFYPRAKVEVMPLPPESNGDKWYIISFENDV